jgi:hypothetical protein
MKPDYLRQKKELVPIVLFVASVALAALILIKATSFFATSARAERLVKKAVAQNQPNSEEMKECVAKSEAIADELKKKNLFAPPSPKQHPVSSVFGILGDEALIGNRWYKVGDKVQEARIVAIEPTRVRIEWEGREKVFAPLQATGQPDSGRPRAVRRSTRAGTQAKSSPQKLAEMVQIGRQEKLGAGSELSNEQIAKLKQKAEKQRLAIEKKEFQKLFAGDKKKPQAGQKKKIPSDIRKAKERAAEKKKSSDIKKSKEKTAKKKTSKLSQK